MAAFAVGAVSADALLRRPDAARTPNNLIAIAFMVVALTLLFRRRWPPSRDLSTLRVGLISLGVTAVLDNLRGLQALSWSGPDLEPVGSTVLTLSLGAIAAPRGLPGAGSPVAPDQGLRIPRPNPSAILPPP